MRSDRIPAARYPNAGLLNGPPAPDWRVSRETASSAIRSGGWNKGVPTAFDDRAQGVRGSSEGYYLRICWTARFLATWVGQ